jgi:hypothetical protein
MPIQSITENPQPPIVGIIRLGIRKETASGVEYPSNVDHFVLTDAPQVARVYGEDPRELDILFPSNDLEASVPSWLKWYGAGTKGKDGKVIGGKLKCKGDGPKEDGTPGVATWYEKMDPKTGVVPTRPCLGDKCPDWDDARGNRQCKPSMTVYVMLPKVSPFGVFAIHTNSWNSIRSFHSQLEWIRKYNNGRIALIPFKIAKTEKKVTFFDKKTQKTTDKTQFVLTLKPIEDPKQIEEMAGTLNKLAEAQLRWRAPAVEQLGVGQEDGYRTISEEEVEVEGQTATKLQTAEELVSDPELAAAFDGMEKALGNKLSPKDRLILIRKKEKAPDIKAEVLATIAQSIEKLNARNAAAQVARVEATPVAEEQPQAAPPQDDGGII